MVGLREKKRKAWNSSANWALNRKDAMISTDLEENKGEQSEENRIFNPLYVLKQYIKNGSLHGLRYIFDQELYNIERFIWFIFMILSIVFTAKIICTVFADFQVSLYIICIIF